MIKNLIIANTGNGKGKTTAAFGMALRAIGHNKRVAIIQFIKGNSSGEVKALNRLAPDLVDIFTEGLGFTWNSKDLEKDKSAALQGWNIAEKALASNSYDLIILDEITYPINYNFLNEDLVIEALLNCSKNSHIIITGRDLPVKLSKICDTISDINEVKHHFNSNIKSQPVIEF